MRLLNINNGVPPWDVCNIDCAGPVSENFVPIKLELISSFR